MQERIILVDDYLEVPVEELQSLLRRYGLEDVELAPDRIVEAKTVWSLPDGVRCKNVGGHRITDHVYVCAKRGRKYLHVFYRTPHMYDASKNRIFFYYFRIRL